MNVKERSVRLSSWISNHNLFIRQEIQLEQRSEESFEPQRRHPGAVKR